MDDLKLSKWIYDKRCNHFYRDSNYPKIHLVVFSDGKLPSGKWSKRWEVMIYESNKRMDEAPERKLIDLNSDFNKFSRNQKGYLATLFLTDVILLEHNVEIEDIFVVPNILIEEE